MSEDDDYLDRLIAQLDKDRPLWHIEWASEMELKQHLGAILAGVNRDIRERRLKRTVAERIFPWVMMSAITAGLVKRQ